MAAASSAQRSVRRSAEVRPWCAARSPSRATSFCQQVAARSNRPRALPLARQLGVALRRLRGPAGVELGLGDVEDPALPGRPVHLLEAVERQRAPRRGFERLLEGAHGVLESPEVGGDDLADLDQSAARRVGSISSSARRDSSAASSATGPTTRRSSISSDSTSMMSGSSCSDWDSAAAAAPASPR